jgi:polar amino acid transport system substrate-binding protein
MSDGSIASIVYTASGDSSVPKEYVEIFCDGKVAVIDDFKTGSFVASGKKTRLGGSTQDKGHAAEVAAFFNAVRGSTGAPIELESLAATTLTTFAIIESARTASTKQIDMRSLIS